MEQVGVGFKRFGPKSIGVEQPSLLNHWSDPTPLCTCATVIVLRNSSSL